MNQKAISQYFEADHDRLDGLFHTFQRFRERDYARARENFVAFLFGLQRHIVWEEHILFPLFEKKTGIKFGGPTDVMRKEHRDIVRHLEALNKKVRMSDPQTGEEEERLQTVLLIHNQKEESILYPAIDSLADEEDRKAVFEAMRNYEEMPVAAEKL